jgi:type II secretory pathway pseudopilin PulG
MMINIFLCRLLQQQPALSPVELLVALTILALLSTAGLKMFQPTQTSFVDGRTSLVKVKRNEAIAAFFYNDFVDKALPPTTALRRYVNNQMPDDMQAA